MEKRFENLHVHALDLADAELTHIAQTEQLPAEDTVRLIAKTLKKADIPRKQTDFGSKTLLKTAPPRKRIRLFGGLLAAAVAIGALGVGVSGWLTYNKPMMEGYFGLEGEARLAAMNLPEQESVISESGVRVTPEAFLWDDHRAIALITFESADASDSIDWLKPMHQGSMDLLYYNCSVLDEDGNVRGVEGNPFTGHGSVMPMSERIAWKKSNECVTAEIEFDVEEGFSADVLTLQFQSETYGRINVPVQVGEKLPTKQFQTDDGMEMYLSPIGFWATGMIGAGGGWEELRLHRADGTISNVYLESIGGYGSGSPDGYRAESMAKVYEVTEGMTFEYRHPETYTAFVNVEDITAIDWSDRHYEPVPAYPEQSVTEAE